ncbi:MAG: hypothetical protein GF355_15885 [Candidatus Eisenbacteria bacterium]|nr:hypothetical protein [Candidatus Eisenbacteria bacterium]
MSSRMRRLSLWSFCIALLLSLPLASDAADRDSDLTVRIRGLGALNAGPTGEVGEYIAGPGIGFTGEAYLGVNEMLYLGGGMDLDFLTGEENRRHGISGTRTDGAVLFLMHLDGMVVFPTGGSLRPFAGLGVGRGGLGWVYDTEYDYDSDDSDGIGFFFLSPQAGVVLETDETIGFVVGLRAIISSYDEETSEGFEWNLDGGSFIRAFAGIDLRF